MSRIISTSRPTCCGIGTINLTVNGERTKSMEVDGKQVSIRPKEIYVQKMDDGSTRVECEHLSNGEGEPEDMGHCLRIRECCRSNCFRLLTGLPVPKMGYDTTQNLLPCKWVIQPSGNKENKEPEKK